MFQQKSPEFARRASDPKEKRQEEKSVKDRLHHLLIEMVDVRAMMRLDEGVVRKELRTAIENLFLSHPDLIRYREKDRLTQELVDEMVGFGPLEELLRDTTISDILINGPRQVYVERNGQMEETSVTFSDNEELVRIIQRIANRVGRRIDESSPSVDARLPDGSRFNAVIYPIALDGALVSIRRFTSHALTPQQFVEGGGMSEEMMVFLQAAVRTRLNMVIAGGTGSGKTTLLNMLSSFVSPKERIVTIEDSAELRLRQPHVARMETRSENSEGKGRVTARDLVRNALRMRPDRIIVGECRGDEVFDMLQAMNTGHDGSLTTIHANSAEDAIGRLEMLLGLAQENLPMWYIRQQVAASIDVIIHVKRLASGKRKVTQIGQVVKDGDQIHLQPLFVCKFPDDGGSPFFESSDIPFELVSKMNSRC
ncbi:CpaF family protein [Bremerella cremea]|uniref:CpaF family protein n=1 Tax=Bremerella cremea TaxID=1031537 RepID=UPI0031EC17EA